MFIIGLTESERRQLLDELYSDYEVIVDGYKNEMTPELTKEIKRLKSIIIKLLKTKRDTQDAIKFFTRWNDPIATTIKGVGE